MARGHGRILTSIWEDEDFKNLDERGQRLYLFLISQPNLNHAGLLPLTLRRWSKKARGLTVTDLEKLLGSLEDTRFIVVDDDTEELLIRTFVRNDGVWRMPKVMAAMVSGAAEISSMKLRRALLAEMDRLPLDELSNEPGTRGVSVRQQVDEHLVNLRRTLRVPDPTPPGNRSGRVTDTPGEGFPKGSDTPGKPTTRAHARASRAHSPAPAPTPAPEEEGGGGSSGQTAPPAPPARRRPDGLTAIDDADFEITDSMRRWAHATYPGVDIDHSTAQFVSHYRSTGARRKSWPDAWQKWVRDDAKKAADRPARHLRPVGGSAPTAPRDTSAMTPEELNRALNF